MEVISLELNSETSISYFIGTLYNKKKVLVSTLNNVVPNDINIDISPEYDTFRQITYIE
jgi:hypothetical protein